uniref:Solute carrier family 15 member 1 n=1 Tax=Jaculus jaculus TaxID=51337 RepID=A0A8C5P3G9_JACJA
LGMSKSRSCFGYPLSIFFIVVNEFCERFSYYGMRALLVLYFKNFLNWDDNLSTAIYHTFVALCYLTPLLGALIADSWLGKFKTIISLSIVYTIGQAVISVSSINDLTDHNHDGTPDSIPVHVALSMIGLVLIALGTGGIKPCVSAFGGDQFEEGQEKQRNRFFSIFYLAINAGSLLSTIITPILRVQQCGIHSQQACYPLAFGVPAALMAQLLQSGSHFYFGLQAQGTFSIKNRFRHRSKAFPKREHWLDWAKEKYDVSKTSCHVPRNHIKSPTLWASGSRWTLQATAMSGKIGAIEIQPDQMQTVNAILIVVMVPIVDAVVYPLIAKCESVSLPHFMVVFRFLKETVFCNVSLKLSLFMTVRLSSLFKTNEFMTFDADKLTSINISSPGSPVTPVTHHLEQGHRHTLLVWAPVNHRVIKDGLNEKPEKGENGIRYDEFFKTYILSSNGCPEVQEFEDIAPNTVNMALQIPQYFLLTCGEVVFSVTGLEFSYSQAPSNMKSVLQAGWLLTVAVGNIIVLIVAGAGHFSKQWAEYILFAALLLVVCVIFAIMARFYTYVNPAEVEAQFDEDEKKKNADKSNLDPTSEPVTQTKM